MIDYSGEAARFAYDCAKCGKPKCGHGQDYCGDCANALEQEAARAPVAPVYEVFHADNLPTDPGAMGNIAYNLKTARRWAKIYAKKYGAGFIYDESGTVLIEQYND